MLPVGDSWRSGFEVFELVLGQGVWLLVHDFGVCLCRLSSPAPPASALPPVAPLVVVLEPRYGLFAPALKVAGCLAK